MYNMPLASSRVTAQGQISVPAEVRRKLGLGPGSVLEWEEHGNEVLIRRAGRCSSEEVSVALFGNKAPKPQTLSQLKAGLRAAVKKRHARD